MVVDKRLAELVRDDDFWSLVFFNDEARQKYRDLTPFEVALPILATSSLIVTLAPNDEEEPCNTLSIFEEGFDEPLQLAYKDLSHPFPDALRWDEVDLIGRAISLNCPDLPHPGLPVLLLAQFTPLCVDDDVHVVAHLLARAAATVYAGYGTRCPDLGAESVEVPWRDEMS